MNSLLFHKWSCCIQWDCWCIQVHFHSMSEWFGSSGRMLQSTKALLTLWSLGVALWFRVAFRNSDGCSKDVHGKHCDMTASHGLTQFSSDGIPHFCILLNAKSSLKKLHWLFLILTCIDLLAVVHFVTWVYVPWLMRSPYLAGRQPNNLESFVHIGERELYSVLEKLPVAADWIFTILLSHYF